MTEELRCLCEFQWIQQNFFVHETAAENVWPTGELTADYVCRVDCT